MRNVTRAAVRSAQPISRQLRVRILASQLLRPSPPTGSRARTTYRWCSSAPATLVAVMLSVCVLVILALPLTWRLAVLVGFMIVSFVLLFPSAAVRTCYALELPNDVLGATILIASPAWPCYW
jgi:hypothetical protein